MGKETLVQSLGNFACFALLVRFGHMELQESFAYICRQLAGPFSAPNVYSINYRQELLNDLRGMYLF